MSTNTSANTANTAKTVGTITQTRQQLWDLLQKERNVSRELSADIKAIVALVKEFKDTVDIPEKLTLTWVIVNRKAIFNLIQGIIKVLKTKNAI